jgi:hypothetical protein
VQTLLNDTGPIGPEFNLTGSDVVASVPWQYPSDGPVYTVNASAKSDTTIGNCTLMVQPVALTVGTETSLLLEAWRDPSGAGHTIYARLVDADDSGLPGYTVTLTVNGTAYTQQTNNTGYVTLHLALQPGDTLANTYQVIATFNGTNPKIANITHWTHVVTSTPCALRTNMICCPRRTRQHSQCCSRRLAIPADLFAEGENELVYVLTHNPQHPR